MPSFKEPNTTPSHTSASIKQQQNNKDNNNKASSRVIRSFFGPFFGGGMCESVWLGLYDSWFSWAGSGATSSLLPVKASISDSKPLLFVPLLFVTTCESCKFVRTMATSFARNPWSVPKRLKATTAVHAVLLGAIAVFADWRKTYGSA